MSTGSTRRQFLARAGVAGAGGAVAGALGAPGLLGTTSAARSGCPMHGRAAPSAGTFGRMFPDLPPFADDSPELRAALLTIGEPGGMLDAKDDLFGPAGGPVNLITDPALSLVNRNNPAHTAGVTFVGQFIDHDLTFDATSKLGVKADPARSPNGRSPRFDLDSVYGAGPMMQSELYDPANPAKLLIESGGQFEDLPRRPDHSAVIADFRNDSNLVISGLHAAFAQFHNRAVDHVSSPGAEPIDVFLTARRMTTWHYQWLVLHQFLPLFVGQGTVDAVLHSRRRCYRPEVQAFVPVEFSGAAYRFGHSMVRPSYRANLAGDNGAPFFGLIFDSRIQVADGATPSIEPDDLRGGFRSPRRFIGWQTFFDFGGTHTAAVRPNKLIDTVLSTPLFSLPLSAIAHLQGDPGPVALPQRTLLRHLTWALPSGQRVARRLGFAPMHRADLADLAGFGLGLDTSTPLWLYILREAQLVTGGRYLGPVGGRIVAEVLVGLLEADPTSYLRAKPGWQPMLGATSGPYTMASFLTFAGVDPASRGQ
ncbi:MAG: hypothetical protein QOF82_2384 [Frankiales bacterium]|nr:hypothetical protein [Frankiales bacterium]